MTSRCSHYSSSSSKTASSSSCGMISLGRNWWRYFLSVWRYLFCSSDSNFLIFILGLKLCDLCLTPSNLFSSFSCSYFFYEKSIVAFEGISPEYMSSRSHAPKSLESELLEITSSPILKWSVMIRLSFFLSTCSMSTPGILTTVYSS